MTIESFVPVNPDGTPWQDPTRPRRFAEGGLVTRETLGILGDAGPELVIPLTKVKDTLGGKDDKKSTKELLKELQAIRKELAAMRAEQGDLSIDMDGQRLGKLQRKARRVARARRVSGSNKWQPNTHRHAGLLVFTIGSSRLATLSRRSLRSFLSRPEASLYPGVNLLNPLRSKRWRSTGVASDQFCLSTLARIQAGRFCFD